MVKTATFAKPETVTAKCKNRTVDNLLLQDKEKKTIKLPTHKTAHLQAGQADTQPNFAKELFRFPRTVEMTIFIA